MNPQNQPFGAALRDLLIAKQLTVPNGNADWATFAKQLEDVSYETLRKAIAGEREPSRKVIEAASDALSVEPRYFVEYRLLDAQDMFDWSAVGYEKAVANLERF